MCWDGESELTLLHRQDGRAHISGACARRRSSAVLTAEPRSSACRVGRLLRRNARADDPLNVLVLVLALSDGSINRRCLAKLEAADWSMRRRAPCRVLSDSARVRLRLRLQSMTKRVAD